MRIIISNTVALNGGDFAILDAILKILQNASGAKIDFIVYDSNPEVASKYYPNINFRKLLYARFIDSKVPGNRFSLKIKAYSNKITLRRLLTAAKYSKNGNSLISRALLTKKEREDFCIYKSADIVISTGGTYLVENYPLSQRFFDFNFTLALKKPLIFFTQSLGPFKKEESKTQIRNVANNAALILLRDKASLNNLKQIGVNIEKARVCADVVFAVADPGILQKAQTKLFGNALKVGISVREWGHFKGLSNEEGMRNYKNSVVALCEYVATELDGKITFISTCQGIKEYGYDDSKIAKEIVNLLSVNARQRTIVDDSFYNPDQLKQIIQGFDIVLSTRMHFAIQSLSTGVPVLPIAYEFKTKELFNKLIRPECILDIDTIKPEATVDAFKTLIQVLPQERKELFIKVEEERVSSLKSVQYLKEHVAALKNFLN